MKIFCKEKVVVTELIPNLSTSKLVQNQLLPHKYSYNFQRYAARESVSNVYLNLTGDTVGRTYRENYCEILNKTNISVHIILSYINHVQAIAYINNSTFSSNFYIDSNNDNLNTDINRMHEHNGIYINDLNSSFDVIDIDSYQLTITDIRL